MNKRDDYKDGATPKTWQKICRGCGAKIMWNGKIDKTCSECKVQIENTDLSSIPDSKLFKAWEDYDGIEAFVDGVPVDENELVNEIRKRGHHIVI